MSEITSNTKKITYTKLRDGNWGVRGPADQVLEGMRVVVTKKSGATKNETVGRIVWSGADRRTGLNISIAEVAKSAPRARRNNSYFSEYCGYPCPVSGRKCCAANGPCHDCE